MSAFKNKSVKPAKCRKQTSECPICGKIFYRYDVFRCHLRIHNNIKPFACNVCGKAFAHRGNLNQHSAVHLQSVSFKCSVCQNAFTNKIYLKRHIKARHPEFYVPSKKGQVLPERRNSKQFFQQDFCEMKHNSVVGSCLTTDVSGKTDTLKLTSESVHPSDLISVPPSVTEPDVFSNSHKTENYFNAEHNTSKQELQSPGEDVNSVFPSTLNTDDSIEHRVCITSKLNTHQTGSETSGSPSIKPTQGTISASSEIQTRQESTNMAVQPALICHFCGEGFQQRHKFQLHVMMHELEQSTVCTVCNKTFSSLPDKRKHELTHSAEVKSSDDWSPLSTNASNSTCLSSPNLPHLKGFSAEELRAVRMIYTVTGTDSRIITNDLSQGLRELNDSENPVIVLSDSGSDID